MSNASEPSNVIDLSQRLDPRSDRVGALLVSVRGLATKRLHALASNMFENIDDALFDLAEKAENNAAQTQFFDGMREVRKKRAIVERTFLGQVARDLADFASGRARAPESDTNARPLANIELSLVGENELEESLAITGMVSKNEQRLARALFAVNQRLSVICGGTRMDDASNPVGPSSLAAAFRQAMRELLVEVKVKLIIYKLFDRYVLAAIDDLYDDINNELATAGVLPQLRHEISTRHSDAPASTGATSETPAATAPAAGMSNLTDAAASEFMQSLHALFSARRGPDMATGVAAGPLPSATELLGALTLLQSQISHLPNAASPLATQADVSRDVAQLKAQLLTQIGQLRGQQTTHVSSMDEDTIDLVGMLFEFILEDHNLPAEMQVLLARLQIPYLKAGLIDRRMFAHKTHPARQLLDALADAAKGWSVEGDRDGRLYDKVKSIVERLLHDFDDDVAIFQRLAAELQEFLDISRKRAELAEQRVAESTRGREKLEQARRRAAQEIVGRIGGESLPPIIYGVLTRAWANYVVLTLLRQGEDSQEFHESLRFIDEFVTSAQPTHDTDSRRRLRSLLPGIERSLRRGLASVAFQEADTEQLLAQLHTYYRQQLGEASAIAEPPVSEMPLPQAIQAIEEPVPPEPDDESETLSDDAFDERYLSQARELKVGQWLEFVAEDGTSDRAKLSWISPISGRYLFVNRRGLKVADHSLGALAQAFANETARVLDSTLLFDRALDSIVEKLRAPQ
ncbi:MAG: hypothetical protein GAK28_00201 [Luteibacter sp.]|uniref:DUF1631 domain-containing protein n=1 Tax=Luteibacter sp. TaxID=1886636 RepID=UPI00138215E3|nr:DUF1631 domain-containing protein [Luteibacter sp.]KAF1009561.1 MAG: hypothetical protein GAK28_00201 [Luteibacter sp.]